MATGYPFKKYNFNVLIDGKAVGYFSEVSAPEMADEPIEYRAGDHQAGTPVKMPGLKKYGLRRGCRICGRHHERRRGWPAGGPRHHQPVCTGRRVRRI